MKNNPVIIDLQNISVSFGDTKILKNINLQIHDGEFVTLLGPSGCGKTTTLRIIAGFLQQDSGDVIFEGKNINGVPAYKRQVNTIFQRYALFPHLNVYENIAFGLRLKKMKEADIRQKVKDMLELVNLKGFGPRHIDSLSGGQQQRVAIARAIAQAPPVILADEPTGNLDSHSSQEIMNILKTLHAEGRTVIVITHDNDIAANAKRIVHIEDGRITSDSSNEGNLSREDIAEEIRGNSTMYESNTESTYEEPELNQTEEVIEPQSDDYDLEISDNNIDLHLMNGENQNEQEE